MKDATKKVPSQPATPEPTTEPTPSRFVETDLSFITIGTGDQDTAKDSQSTSSRST